VIACGIRIGKQDSKHPDIIPQYPDEKSTDCNGLLKITMELLKTYNRLAMPELVHRGAPPVPDSAPVRDGGVRLRVARAGSGRLHPGPFGKKEFQFVLTDVGITAR
jgi:hypothetical protein